MYDPYPPCPLISSQSSQTIGDAIASFLERPDLFATDQPFLNRQQERMFKVSGVGGLNRCRKPRFTLRWWNAHSSPRWIVLTLCIVTITVVSLLLEYGNGNLTKKLPSIPSPYGIGFGAYNPATTLNIFSTSFISPTATESEFASKSLPLPMMTVVNLPQMIVSCLYFAHNTVYTSMVSADEFSRFSSHRIALRTTNSR
jgi:hypothetical protein